MVSNVELYTGFFRIFLQSTHQVDMKNIVECQKYFFAYFNALETYGVNAIDLLPCLCLNFLCHFLIKISLSLSCFHKIGIQYICQDKKREKKGFSYLLLQVSTSNFFPIGILIVSIYSNWLSRKFSNILASEIKLF